MSMRMIYWVLMLLWLISGVYVSYHSGWSFTVGGTGSLVEFLLFLLLGWKVFGAPVSG